MRKFLKALGLIIPMTLAALAFAPSEAKAQEKSMALTISAPDTTIVNRTITISATLSDAWSNQRLPGRVVQFGIGEEFYLSNAGYYNTPGNGTVSITRKFTRKGRYRVVAYVDSGYGYLSQRTLRFIEVR